MLAYQGESNVNCKLAQANPGGTNYQGQGLPGMYMLQYCLKWLVSPPTELIISWTFFSVFVQFVHPKLPVVAWSRHSQITMLILTTYYKNLTFIIQI